MFDSVCYNICMIVFASVALVLYLVITIVAVFRDSEECKAVRAKEQAKRVKEIKELFEESINRGVLEELLNSGDNFGEQLELLRKEANKK